MSRSRKDLVVPDDNDDVLSKKSWKEVVLVPKNVDLAAEDRQRDIGGSLPFALMHEGCGRLILSQAGTGTREPPRCCY